MATLHLELQADAASELPMPCMFAEIEVVGRNGRTCTGTRTPSGRTVTSNGWSTTACCGWCSPVSSGLPQTAACWKALDAGGVVVGTSANAREGLAVTTADAP